MTVPHLGSLFALVTAAGLMAGCGSTSKGTSADDPRTASPPVTPPVVIPPQSYVEPSAVTGDVVVAMDSSSGLQAISPWIYGVNDAGNVANWGTHPTRSYVTLNRMGGNRMSEYNWENNWSNGGADYYFHNDQLFSTSTTPGDGVTRFAGAVYGRTHTLGNAALVAVPLTGYVSAAWSGCDQGTPYTAAAGSCNAPLPAAAGTTSPGAPQIGASGRPNFLTYLTSRPGDTTHAHATASPDLSDTAVYEDDFLKWFDTSFPGHKTSASEPIFISMDGEPDGWGAIHPEVRGAVGATQHLNGGAWDGTYTFTKVQLPFEDLIGRTTAAAKTVKDMLGAGALVFGPVTAGWSNHINLDHQSPPQGYDYFLEYYLDQLKQASQADGRRLLDVLDVHLYSEATDGGAWDIRNEYAPQNATNIMVREQAPRTFWDPTYNEQSWITYWGTVPVCGLNCTPQMIRRFQAMIDQRYPGTKLGVSEWAFERAGDMSGGIAVADMLGIFAREGVYQASAWPNSSQYAYGYGTVDKAYQCFWGAYSAYVNYDGAGGHFGDTLIPTAVDDPHRPVDWLVSGKPRNGGNTSYPAQTLERVTVYSSYDEADPSRVVIVALNKSINEDGSLPGALDVGFRVKHPARFSKADVYRMKLGTSFSQLDPANASSWPAAAADCGALTKLNGNASAPDISITAVNAFNAVLPSQSITVFVLKP